MNKFYNFFVALIFLFLTTTSAYATNNFLGGIGHAQVSSYLSPNTAGMAAVEAGPRNYRASGTVGWALNPCNRIKVTTEWLWQNIDYNFVNTTTTKEWVQQTAVGVGYELALNNRFINSVDLTGYYSHAPSYNLISVNYLDNTTGNIYGDIRRIAGSNAGGISPVVNIHPWIGAEGKLGLNWDDVVYDTQNRSGVNARGFGGTAALTQFLRALGQDFRVGASVAVRAPFNNYRANVDWVTPLQNSEFSVGVFGSYTEGKKTLANTSLVGVNLAYAMDVRPCRTPCTLGINSQSLVGWVSDPAVYMPEVLTIVDESANTCPPGSAPLFIGHHLGNIMVSSLPFPASSLFAGNNLVYSAPNLPPGDTINPSTGEITGTVTGTNIVIFARGPCGPPAQTNPFAIVAG